MAFNTFLLLLIPGGAKHNVILCATITNVTPLIFVKNDNAISNTEVLDMFKHMLKIKSKLTKEYNSHTF